MQASAIERAHIAERSRKSQEIKLAWIAECSRHYEKGNLLYEGQRPVTLRVCVLRAFGAWHFRAVDSKMPNVLIAVREAERHPSQIEILPSNETNL